MTYKSLWFVFQNMVTLCLFFSKEILWTFLQLFFFVTKWWKFIQIRNLTPFTPFIWTFINVYCIQHTMLIILSSPSINMKLDIRKWEIIEMSSLEPIIIIDQSNPFPIEYQRTQLGPKCFGKSQHGKKQTNNILQ